MAAVGLNPTDWKHVGNNMHYYTITKATPENPVVLGSEGSGTVETVADGSPFQIGDRVWFLSQKTCAEPCPCLLHALSPIRNWWR